MEIKAYSLDSLFWNNNSVDKVTQDFFSVLLNNPTVYNTNFSLNNLMNISISLPTDTIYNYFSININQTTLYYLVHDFNYKSNSTIQYNLELDIYTSFVMPSFAPYSLASSAVVFFTRKHMSRFNAQGVLNQLEQPYLFHSTKDQEAFNNLDKIYQSVPNFISFTGNVVVYSCTGGVCSQSGFTNLNDTLFNYTTQPLFPNIPPVYLYAIIQRSPNFTPTSYVSTNKYPFGLAPVLTAQFNNIPPEYSQAFLTLESVNQLGSNCVNLIALPMPPSQIMNSSLNTYTITQYASPGSTALNDGQTVVTLPPTINWGELFTFSSPIGANFNPAQGTANIWQNEPFNNLFCQKVFLQNGIEEVSIEWERLNFNNLSIADFFYSLTSYSTTDNWVLGLGPTTYSNYINYQNNDGLHKQFNVFVNVESIIPSLTDNWTNYLNNSQNQYSMNKYQNNLNIAQSVTDTAAEVASSAVDVADAADIFSEGSSLAAAGTMALKAINSGFNIARQSREHVYLNHGMAKDMGRVGVLKGINSPNLIPQNFNILYVTTKKTNDFNQEVIFLEFAKNGYLFNNYATLGSWYNREMFNFVAINNFVEATLLQSYFQGFTFSNILIQAINAMLENGIRIWSTKLDWRQIANNREVEQ